MKNYKKIINVICILLIIVLSFFIYTSSFQRAGIYNTYEEYDTKYENLYNRKNYVDENLNASKFFHNTILSTMYNSGELITDFSIKSILFTPSSIFNNEIDFDSYIIKNQYKETTAARAIPKINETKKSNYTYVGNLKDKTYVFGNIAIYHTDDNYSLVLSLADSENNLVANRAKLLVDDSNAENIAYDIVKYMQFNNGLLMEPNEASKYFFGSTIEQLAGSISYHAVLALYNYEEDNNRNKFIKNKTLQVNIETQDIDSIFINKGY